MCVQEAAWHIGCDPWALRCQLKADPNYFGFRVLMLGKKIYIPRKKFEQLTKVDEDKEKGEKKE